jgi:hypothetical protein
MTADLAEILAKGSAETLRRYWTEGEGAAKIRWGEGGDFNRCVRQIREHAPGITDPEGYCAKMHHRALGYWPATHKKMIKGAGDVPVPMLVTIPGVDILAAGQWNLVSGQQEFTPGDLAAAVMAAQCPSVGDPIIKIGHKDPNFDGEPAVGRVRHMRLAQQGNKITGDLAGMPGWLGSVAASAYPRRSIEGTYNFRCQTGHDHPFVITALALLGVTPPGVGVLSGLPEVAALYGVEAAAGERWATEAGGAMPAGQVQAGVVSEADVRRAYYDREGTTPTLWITELRMDPAELIVADEAGGKVYRVPFSIEAGAVQFGEPREVQVTYADVMAMRGATGPVVTFASAAESRDLPQLAEPGGGQGEDPDPAGPAPREVVAAWDGGAAVACMGDDPSASAIRAMFAIPRDTKSDSSLPHHNCSGGTVGGANPDGCSAAIAALNGGRGGLKGVSASQARAAYNHLAAHLRAAGREPPEFKGAGSKAASAGAGQLRIDAAGRHGTFTGTHSHPHAAMGQQGGDTTHDHSHTHSGSGSHAHVHAAAGSTRGGKVDFTEDQLAALRSAFGLGEDEELTEEQIVAAAGALRERADAHPVAAGAPQLPRGVIAVDKEAWDALNMRVRRGEEARAAQLRDQRDQVIAAAIRQGKFSVAQRDRWVRAWDAAPDQTREVLASLQPNVVPVGDVGTPGNPDDESMSDEYSALFPPEYRAATARQG